MEEILFSSSAYPKLCISMPRCLPEICLLPLSLASYYDLHRDAGLALFLKSHFLVRPGRPYLEEKGAT
jgi:hypothetical protein